MTAKDSASGESGSIPFWLARHLGILVPDHVSTTLQHLYPRRLFSDMIAVFDGQLKPPVPVSDATHEV